MAKTKIRKLKSSNGKSRPSRNNPKSSKSNNKIIKHVIWVEKKGLSPRLIEKIVTKQISEENFEPSMKMLTRIMNSIIEKGSSNKTNLSHGTNLNYSRLVKHILWLENRGLVKSIVENSKIKIKLTDRGRSFAETITKNENK